MKSKVILALILILLTSLWLTSHNSENERITNKSLEFIRSYRYHPQPDSTLSEYREYETLLKILFRIYVNFTSLGVNHFSMAWIGYLENLASKKNWLVIFFRLADRMVKNLAFVPGLYEIDIHTGKAFDFPEAVKQK